jgi:hypothetical protein
VTRREIGELRFEWDERKAASNLRKHGIDFADAALIFLDEHLLVEPSPVKNGEERFQAIGMAIGVVILFVAFTERTHDGKESTRIISARKASAQEQRRYFAAL